MDDTQVGLYEKFTVLRNDGKDRPGGPKAGARYFVLDLAYDKFTPVALRAYADACDRQYPLLAQDLRRVSGDIKTLPAPKLYTYRIDMSTEQGDFIWGPGYRTMEEAERDGVSTLERLSPALPGEIKVMWGEQIVGKNGGIGLNIEGSVTKGPKQK